MPPWSVGSLILKSPALLLEACSRVCLTTVSLFTDIMVDSPDEQSIVTYVAQFLERFPELEVVCLFSLSLIQKCTLPPLAVKESWELGSVGAGVRADLESPETLFGHVCGLIFRAAGREGRQPRLCRPLAVPSCRGESRCIRGHAHLLFATCSAGANGIML